MIPENTLSSTPVVGGFMPPDIDVLSRLVDYEDAGVDVQNTSQGNMGYRWSCFVDNSTVLIQRDGLQAQVVFEQPRIREITFTFDQNMRPSVAYELDDDSIELRWYDTQANNYVVTKIDVGRNPRLTMDDKRPESAATSDIILAYIRGDGLYYRQQRDRYQTERLLRSGIDKSARLRNIGMTDNLRLYFEIV